MPRKILFGYEDKKNKAKQLKKTNHTINNKNKAEVAILVSEKLDFRSKNITGDKERDFRQPRLSQFSNL